MSERSEVMEQEAVRDASPGYSVEAGTVSAEDVPPGYKRTEVGVIPEDWRDSELKEFVNFANGKPHERNISPYGRFSLITLDSIGIDGKLKSDHKKIQINDGSLAKGDIVAILSDIAHGNLLGLCDVIPEDNKYVLNQRVGRLRLPPTVDSGYIRLQINRNQHHFKARGQGSSQRHIYKRDFDSLRVPIPYLKEQRAIATAMSDADALIESLDRLIAKKRAMKQAAMQQLLTGQTRLPGFSGEWETKRLGDLFRIRAGTSKAKYIRAGGEFLVADMGSVSRDGQLIAYKPTDFNADLLEKGELIMPKDDIGGGNIIGKVAYIDADDRYVLGDHVYALTLNDGVSKFFSYLINSSEVNSSLRSKVSGSAQLGLSSKAVKNQAVLVPSISEQQGIATILSHMDTEIEALEDRRDKVRQTKQGMMQQLLTGRVRLVEPEAAA